MSAEDIAAREMGRRIWDAVSDALDAAAVLYGTPRTLEAIAWDALTEKQQEMFVLRLEDHLADAMGQVIGHYRVLGGRS